MAAASTALRLCARAIARPRPTPTLRARPLVPHRTFASTAFRWRPANTPDEGDEAALVDEEASEYNFVEAMLADLPPEQQTPELKQEMRDLEARLSDQERVMHKSLDEESITLFKEPRPLKDSFWFDEEDDDTMTHDIVGEDFDEDDIPTVAHGKLDELREHRHYARIVAWEMPMLASMSPSPLGSYRRCHGRIMYANHTQNSPSPSSPRITTSPSASVPRPTSASTTPRSARSS